MPSVRLQKILSAAGIASRRAAETMIVAGRVTVNAETVTELGTRADPDRDDIRVDGRRIAARRHQYLLLNKPRGYVTTRSDPQGRPTVMALIPESYRHLYPVGRLDYDSEGLLILTNDGDLAAQLMHPSHEVEREYHARVRGVPAPESVRRLARGVLLDGRRTAPARVHVVETGRGARGDQAIVSIALHEGRARQVRRMCEAVGHPVIRLRRVRIGPIVDAALKPGGFRELSRAEIDHLEHVAAARAKPPRRA